MTRPTLAERSAEIEAEALAAIGGPEGLAAAQAVVALIDSRIELALDAARTRSLDEYIHGRRDARNRVPQSADVKPGLVEAAGVGGRVGPVVQLGDEVSQLAHDFAPSRSGEGSVGASPVSGMETGTGDTTGGAA